MRHTGDGDAGRTGPPNRADIDPFDRQAGRFRAGHSPDPNAGEKIRGGET